MLTKESKSCAGSAHLKMRMKDLGRENIRTAKAQLELNAAAAVKDTKNASTNPSPTKGGCGRESPSFIRFKTDFQGKGAGVLLTDHQLVFQPLLNLSPWYLLQTHCVSVYLSARVGFPGNRRGGIVYSLAFFFFN